MDLKKAFDAVDHVLLLAKLKLYGVTGLALNLFKSYFAECLQVCPVNGKLSNSRIVNCGVPQGSIHNGPLPFLVYISDLPNCLQFTSARLFAGDTNITASGKSIEEVEWTIYLDLLNRAVTKALIGGGGGCIFIYLRSARRISFEINCNDNYFQKKFVGQNANI